MPGGLKLGFAVQLVIIIVIAIVIVIFIFNLLNILL